jgi:hypothetical protein
MSTQTSVKRWSTKITAYSTRGLWKAESPSESLLTTCKLCWRSGKLCLFCVSVAAWSLVVSPNTLQQLVHLGILHGTWHTVRLSEVCWLLQNVKHISLKTFKVTEHVRVFVCVFFKHNMLHVTVFSETENLLQTTVLSQTQTVQHRLLYYRTHRQLHSLSYSYCSYQRYKVSRTYVAVVLYWVLLETGSDYISEILWFCVDKLGNVCTNMFVPLQTWCSRYFLSSITKSAIWQCVVCTAQLWTLVCTDSVSLHH